MAFGYETSQNIIKNDYTKQSLVMHQKQVDKLYRWKYIVIIIFYLQNCHQSSFNVDNLNTHEVNTRIQQLKCKVLLVFY